MCSNAQFGVESGTFGRLYIPIPEHVWGAEGLQQEEKSSETSTSPLHERDHLLLLARAG